MNPSFIFDRSTPELDEYLRISQMHPGYKYVSGCATPTKESKKAVYDWQSSVDLLRSVAGDALIREYHSARKAWMCRDETATPGVVSQTSPNGEFRVDVTSHPTGDGTWSYTKGRVYEGNRLIQTVYRNYPSFPIAWVENHAKTGHDYLICGADYMGQTVIDLITEDRVDSPPVCGGFCWIKVNPNAEGTTLAVSGCYWGGPDEVIIVDFEDPMSPAKWTEVAHFTGSGSRWGKDGSCSIETPYEVVDIPGHRLDGKKEDDCTSDEVAEVDKEALERNLPEKGYCDAGWCERVQSQLWFPV